MESAGPNQASEARGGGGGGGKLGLSHRGVERLANKMFFFFGGGRVPCYRYSLIYKAYKALF